MKRKMSSAILIVLLILCRQDVERQMQSKEKKNLRCLLCKLCTKMDILCHNYLWDRK